MFLLMSQNYRKLAVGVRIVLQFLNECCANFVRDNRVPRFDNICVYVEFGEYAFKGCLVCFDLKTKPESLK